MRDFRRVAALFCAKDVAYYYRHITVIIQPNYFYISFCRFFVLCSEYLFPYPGRILSSRCIAPQGAGIEHNARETR